MFPLRSPALIPTLILALILSGLAPLQAFAQSAAPTPPEGELEFNLSPYTVHFSPSDEHKSVWLLGMTQVAPDGTLIAGAVFSNSFGQRSAALQYGHRYERPFGWERWYWQWTAGLMYGYVEPYKDKVPLNYKGFSPVIVPSLGYHYDDRISGQLMLLGDSALMFQLSYTLPQH
jgi:hypothetical protein